MIFTILARLIAGSFFGYILAKMILDFMAKGHNPNTYVYIFLMFFVYILFKYEMKEKK